MNEIKILIVDDEEKARLYLASILEELYPKFEIQLVASPIEALYLINKYRYDLLLLDVEMQGMTGLELVAELQKLSYQPPIIFISAYKRADFIQQAMRLSAIDYIDKPVNPTELDSAIYKALQSKQVQIHQPKQTLSTKKICLLTDRDERFVNPQEIIYFKSFKRYSTALLVDGTCLTVRSNLVNLASVLPKEYFSRISRQIIVNCEYIKSISKANKTLTVNFNNTDVHFKKVFPQVLAELSYGKKPRNTTIAE